MTSRWNRRGVVVTALAIALVACVVLRFVSTSAMWLDEAQTVEIARRPLPGLFHALRHDGSPPLYYVLLHAWMTVVGTGTFAVRALSGILAIAALPVIWIAARRVGADRWTASVALLLLAANPFAVRYATEARMYSLVVLLWLATFVVLHRWWRRREWWCAGVGAVLVASMLLTQYWSLFAVAAVGLGAIVVAVRGDRRGWWLLLPLGIGCLGMLPWLPSFLFQLRHTGAPWGSPPSIGEAFDTPARWAGSGPFGTGDLLSGSYYALVVLSVFARTATGGVLLTTRLRKTSAVLAGIAFATMLIGTAVNGALGSAYAPRYSAVALAPFLLAAALGFGTLSARWRNAAVAVVVVLGLASCVSLPTKQRTQAKATAAALRAAAPGDVVVFCPDQLGPAVHRLAPRAGRQLVYPTMGSPAMVDWVDYAKRNEAADPERFTRKLLSLAGSASIWLVYEPGYPTFNDDCSALVVDIASQRGAPMTVLPVQKGAGEKERVVRFGAPH